MPTPELETKQVSKNIRFLAMVITAICGVILGLGLSQIKTKNDPLPQYARSTVTENLPQVTVSKTSSPLRSNANPGNNPGRTFSVKNNAQSAANGRGSRKTNNIAESLLRLKDYIKSIEEKNTLLKEKIELLNSLVTAREKEISKLNEDNLGFKDDFNKTMEAQAKIKTELEDKIKSLNEMLTQKDSDIAALNTIKVNLQYQVDELNKKMAALISASATMEKLIQDKSNLESELSRLKDELKKQITNNEALTKNVTALKETMDKKDRDRQSLATELEQLQLAKNETEAELVKLQVLKEGNEAQMNELKLRLKEANASYQEMKESGTQAAALLSKKELEKELNISNKEKEIEEIKDNMYKKVEDIKANLYKVTAERDSLASSLQEKERKMQQLDEKLNSLDPSVSSLQKELASEKERQLQISQQFDKAMELNKSLKERLRNITTELELLRAENKMNAGSFIREDTVEISVPRESRKSSGSPEAREPKESSGYIRIRREPLQ